MILEQNDLYFQIDTTNNSGKAVLLFPALGCHADFCFGQIAPVLEQKGYNPVFVDLPAHGRSKGRLKIPELRDSVSKLTRQLSEDMFDSVSVMAHSLGAFIVAGSSHEYMDKLILSGLPLTLQGTTVAKQLGPIAELPYPVARALVCTYDRVRLLMHKRYRDSNLPHREGIGDEAYFGAIRMSRKIFEDLRDLTKFDKRLPTTESPAPTLLIYGANENRLGMTEEDMQRAKTRFGRNAELVIVPGADHNLNRNKQTGQVNFRGLEEKIIKHLGRVSF
jgi:pimeloyl-ACP methyl ester carboxylesterase